MLCGRAGRPLHLKAALLEVSGETPRTHRLRDLLAALSRLAPNMGGALSEFTRENREGISLLEQYHLSSRYLPYPCDREDAQNAVDVAQKLIDIVGEVVEAWRRGG